MTILPGNTTIESSKLPWGKGNAVKIRGSPRCCKPDKQQRSGIIVCGFVYPLAACRREGCWVEEGESEDLPQAREHAGFSLGASGPPRARVHLPQAREHAGFSGGRTAIVPGGGMSWGFRLFQKENPCGSLFFLVLFGLLLGGGQSRPSPGKTAGGGRRHGGLSQGEKAAPGLDHRQLRRSRRSCCCPAAFCRGAGAGGPAADPWGLPPHPAGGGAFLPGGYRLLRGSQGRRG